MEDRLVDLSDLTVAILCGGRGTRLHPWTESIPKALVPLNDRPILDYILEFYRRHGIRRFIFCIGYLGDKIRQRYEGSAKDFSIEFSDSGEKASMLERIVAVRDAEQPRLMVSYGDTFTSLDLHGMVRTHFQRRALATIVVAPIQNPFGLITFNPEGWVTSFREKPVLHYYIGHFIFERETYKLISPEMLGQPEGHGLVSLFSRLLEERKLASFEHQGVQITFNTESERRKAEEDLGKFYTFSEESWQS
jgi:NDP-sugar pyrophosphorylase family protein